MCLPPLKTSQASALKPVREQDHVGMEMSARCLISSRDFFRTVENQPPLEPCNLVLLIIIMVF